MYCQLIGTDLKDCRITVELQKAFTLDHLVHGEESCPTVQKQTLKKHNKSNNTWIWTKQKIKSIFTSTTTTHTFFLSFHCLGYFTIAFIKYMMTGKMGTFKTCSVYKNSACEESVSQYKHYIEGEK